LVRPNAGSKDVEKAIMANLRTELRQKTAPSAEAIRNESPPTVTIPAKTLPRKARACFTAKNRQRGIYGKATPQQAKDMIEEGHSRRSLFRMPHPIRNGRRRSCN